MFAYSKSFYADHLASIRKSPPRSHSGSISGSLEESQVDLHIGLPIENSAVDLTEAENRLSMSQQFEEIPQNLEWPKANQQNVTQIPDVFDTSGLYYWCPTRSIEDADIVSNLEVYYASLYLQFFFVAAELF